MQITELLKLTEWFYANVKDKGITSKYTLLYNKMHQNANRNNYQPQAVPFSQEKNNLCEAIKLIDFNELSLEQIYFLKQLKIVDLLGESGAVQIDDIISKNNLDIATATSKIKELVDTINNAQSTITEIATVLQKSFKIDDIDEVEDGNVLMRVYFCKGVAINNLADLKKFSSIWYNIGRGIALAQDKTPEDFKIIGAKKGSIIIELVVACSLAKIVSKILLEALKVADRILDIRKKYEEIKSMQLKNKKIEQEIKKEADQEKSDGIKHIIYTVIKDLEMDIEKQGDKISATEKSIEELIDFIEKGGSVDFVQPTEHRNNADKSINNEFKQLSDNMSKIRTIENKIKMLEEKPQKTNT
jgi:hypothetical protein